MKIFRVIILDEVANDRHAPLHLFSRHNDAISFLWDRYCEINAAESDYADFRACEEAWDDLSVFDGIADVGYIEPCEVASCYSSEYYTFDMWNRE